MSENDVREDQLPRGAGTAGAEVIPIPAASTIVLRGHPYEILLMRRHERSTFVPGAWVFPGGTLDPSDAALAGAEGEIGVLKACAIRELFEETGIWLGEPPVDAERLRGELLAGRRPFSEIATAPLPLGDLLLTERWITPIGVPKRFDTWFFLVEVPAGTEATPEHSEGVEMLWIEPAAAVERHRQGTLPMVFPTIRNLERIAGFASAAALLDSRRGREVRVTLPVLVIDGDKRTIVLPEDQVP